MADSCSRHLIAAVAAGAAWAAASASRLEEAGGCTPSSSTSSAASSDEAALHHDVGWDILDPTRPLNGLPPLGRRSQRLSRPLLALLFSHPDQLTADVVHNPGVPFFSGVDWIRTPELVPVLILPGTHSPGLMMLKCLQPDVNRKSL